MSTLKILRQRQRTAQVISRMASAMKMVARSHLRRYQGDHKITKEGLQDLRRTMESLLFYVAQQEGVNPQDLATLTNTPLSAFSSLDTSWDIQDENSADPSKNLGDNSQEHHVDSHNHGEDMSISHGGENEHGGFPGEKNLGSSMGPSLETLNLTTVFSLPRILRPGHALAPWIVLVMTSKGGLCGGFNQNILKATKECLKDFDNRGIPIRLWAFGEKSKGDLQKISPRNFMDLDAQGNNLRLLLEQLERCSINDDSCLMDAWDSLGGSLEDQGNDPQNSGHSEFSSNAEKEKTPQWERDIFNTSNPMKSISHGLTYLFCQGKIQGCTLIYSKFVNILTQEAFQENLLPLTLNPNPQGDRIEDGLFIYEPSGKKVLEKGLSLLVDNLFQSRFQEHRLSECGARINAMENAENNAKDLFSALRLEYNHLRQSKITSEIIEINNY